ncbi:MAG: serine proteinase [Lawsonibacter sp.]
MGFFDNFKEKATDLAQAGVAQSKRLAEIAKLKTSNMAEEDTIRKAYQEIGKLYYAEKGLTPEGAYAAACEKITAARAAIEANNDRIAELKASGDVEEVEPTEYVVEEPVTAAEPVVENPQESEQEEPKSEE